MSLDDIASLTAAPRIVRLGGEPVAVSPLCVDDLGTLQAWVDAQFPDPFDLVNGEIARGRLDFDEAGKPVRVPYTVPQQQFLLRVAAEQRERGRRLIGTPEADAKLQTMEGTKQLLLLSIRKAQPDFSEADADRLFRRMTLGDVAQLVIVTGLDVVTSDPKAPTPTGPTPDPAAGPTTGNRKARRRARSSTGGRSTTGR